MNAAKKGLGRGLSALFGDIEKQSTSNQVQTNKIPIADLQRNKYQPRNIFDEDKLTELIFIYKGKWHNTANSSTTLTSMKKESMKLLLEKKMVSCTKSRIKRSTSHRS